MSEVNKELKNILEAALLVAGKPLSIKRMEALFPKDSVPTNEELKQAIDELQKDYADHGIELKQVGKGYRFQSQEKYSEWVSRLFEERPARYSRALLETLAIIAYRQPVTRGDIEDVRGVTVSTETMRTLLEREWVREVGHRDVPGKPALFGTAPGFLEHFNLKGLSDLPPLSELRDLEEISRELNFNLDSVMMGKLAKKHPVKARTTKAPMTQLRMPPRVRLPWWVPPVLAEAMSESTVKGGDKPQGEKLQKVLARAGVGSRREMERWISEGRVSVDGQVAKLGDRVLAEQTLRVDGHVLRHTSTPPRRRILIYNKPEGELCTRSDPAVRPTIFQRLPRIHRGRWINIGRLDFNSSGLMLATNDGDLANRLMHPSSEIEREYAVRVQGQVTEDMIRQLRRGVELEDGMASFGSISDAGGEGSNHWYRVTLKEGRNREVRRMWEAVGAARVSRLIRVRFGPVHLPRGLSQGHWEDIDDDSMRRLLSEVGLEHTMKQTNYKNKHRRKRR